jgi:hypothetical protein
MLERLTFWQKALIVWLGSLLLTYLTGEVFSNKVLFSIFAFITTVAFIVLIICGLVKIFQYLDSRFIEEKVRTKRPLGITIIAFLELLAVFSLFQLGGDYKLSFFGFILSPWAAKIWLLLNIALSVYLGIGFLKLVKKAWYLYIIRDGIVLPLAISNLFLVDMRKLLLINAALIQYKHALAMFRASLIFSIVLTIALLIYVIRKKDVFKY